MVNALVLGERGEGPSVSIVKRYQRHTKVILIIIFVLVVIVDAVTNLDGPLDLLPLLGL